ncbi:hypothetical protein F511_16321 [Dorcoceras hygrometricum]|uniref:Uncharacterized protein n=1 Tax=Dorcoceras hygrometricum TaxID=472368 RepID=A0A2Z7BUF0_9LAMI|nr:hypothetical protein F511_16321 [Dorcoceras hygrometricum]
METSKVKSVVRNQAEAKLNQLEQELRSLLENRSKKKLFSGALTRAGISSDDLMSNVEQEADNSKSNSEESDVVLKNQQMVRVQQMATVEWIQQKRKDKDSADDM